MEKDDFLIDHDEESSRDALHLRASAVHSSIQRIKITAETQRPRRDRKAGTMKYF